MLTQEQLTMMAENVARIRENMAAAAREAGDIVNFYQSNLEL